MEESYLIFFLFFTIAMLYSSVGFGGGSSYSALLAVLDTPYLLLRTTALLCNLVVVSGGTYLFYKDQHLSIKQAFPFIVLSIPMAVLGGAYRINERPFFLLLGGSLLLAGILMLLQSLKNKKPPIVLSPSTSRFLSGTVKTLIGGLIGLLSGLVGIGGGIFLAPILHLSKWGSPHRIAALTSFFILVNSIAGLIGQAIKGNFTIDFSFTFGLLVAVFLGGQIGSRMGTKRFSPFVIRTVTAFLIVFVAIRILYQYL